MSHSPRRRIDAAELAAAAAAYQEASVIPHCAVCAKPCCKLETLVLDLNWRQIKSFWKVESSRHAFDKQLAAGQGPQEIREAGGRYYVHGKPCPSYDLAQASCRIYGQDIKPRGCSDFPVYEDEGALLADLRCEAVDLDALTASITGALGPGFRLVSSADAEFPFLVTLAVRTAGKKRK